MRFMRDLKKRKMPRIPCSLRASESKAVQFAAIDGGAFGFKIASHRMQKKIDHRFHLVVVEFAGQFVEERVGIARIAGDFAIKVAQARRRSQALVWKIRALARRCFFRL